MEKRCFKCGLVKSLDEFYPHPRMADGRLGKCKPCARSDVKSNRELMAEYYRRFDQLRQQTPERKEKKLEYRANYLAKHPDADKVRSSRYGARYPEKRAAHIAVGNAIRDKRIIKHPCEVCGATKVEVHHDDYSKPLEVRWLCKTHHMDQHWERPTVDSLMALARHTT